MTQPLSGLLVLDFTTLLPGPLATLMLAEAGAEIIKIERPGGEEMRAHANRRKRVFGGLMIVEQVFGGVIAAGAFDAWRRKGEKACHFVGLQNDSVTAWDCGINLRGD